MYDTAVAFTEWCNEQGGILGREIVLSDADAKLFDYEPAMTEACGRDFALVGGGAVFDEDPNDVRVGCDLPNIAGYVVSARGRSADLQVQPIPNSIYEITMGRYNAAARDFPDSGAKYGIMASAIPSVLLVKQQSIEVAESKGFEVAYSYDYQTQGETGWASFVREMQDKDIKILEFIGQPQNLIELTDEMAIANWHPEVILLSPNFYDDLYRQGAGTDSNLYIQSAFHPIEMADENKATQDYLDLMEQYNPGRKGRPARHAGPVVVAPVRDRRHASAARSSRPSACWSRPRRRRTGRVAVSTPARAPATPSRARASCSSASTRRASSTTRRPPPPPRGSTTATRRTCSR